MASSYGGVDMPSYVSPFVLIEPASEDGDERDVRGRTSRACLAVITVGAAVCALAAVSTVASDAIRGGGRAALVSEAALAKLEFEGVDDSEHTSCHDYVSDARIDADSCDTADTYLCETVLNDWLDGEWTAEFIAAGCNMTCGEAAFGPCLLTALSSVETLCAARPVAELPCAAITAKGECWTSTGCEWESSRSTCFASSASTVYLAAPPVRAAAPAPAPRRLQSAHDQPSPAPSLYVFHEYPDCDIHAYCKHCAYNATCDTLLEQAFHGSIGGVDSIATLLGDAARMGHLHGWHAGQAAVLVMNLTNTCEVLPSLNRTASR